MKRTRGQPAPAPGQLDPAVATWPGWKFAAACALLCLLLALRFWPSFEYPVLPLDDRSLLRAFTGRPLAAVLGYDHFGHLRPLENLLFWLLARDPSQLAAFRAGIFGCFLASVVLLAGFASRRLQSREWGVAVAACWAMNPSISSTVAWLSAANLVVCLLGSLVFLQFGLRALGPSRSTRVHRLDLALAWAGLLVAVASHELAWLAPLLLLALRPSAGSVRPSRALWIGSAACIGCVLVLRLLGTAPAVAYRSASQAAGWQVLGAARYALENASLWFWLPGRFGVLLVDRPADHVWASVIAWVALLALGAAGWWLARCDRVVPFALMWCGVWLLPVTNLSSLDNPVALHYLFLPSVGLSLLLVRAAQRASSQWRRVGWLPGVLLASWIVVCLPEGQRALAAWGDAEILYTETVRNYPDNIEARANLSGTYLEQGRYAEATALLDESLQLAPQDAILLGNRLELLWQTGRTQEALELFEQHAQMFQGPALGFLRGKILEKLGRNAEAAAAFQLALERAEDGEQQLRAGYALAITLTQLERFEEATALIERLLVQHPGREELLTAKRLLETLTH